MQDEYTKTFGKLHMSDERKKEMRDILAAELKNSGRKARKTGLTSGQKAGIAAAAVAVTMAGVLCVPVTRNAIYATIKSLFEVEVPEGAVDSREHDLGDRDMTRDAVSQWPEIRADLDNYYKEQDEYYESVKIAPDNISNMDLSSLAKYYEDQGYFLEKLEDGDFDHGEGFAFHYHVGDNASGYEGSVMVFEASKEQLQDFMRNEAIMINRLRVDHGQESVSMEDLWTEGTDEEGNLTYVAEWVGPEPELKLMDSDSARFQNDEIVYSADTGIAVFKMEAGGGVG